MYTKCAHWHSERVTTKHNNNNETNRSNAFALVVHVCMCVRVCVTWIDVVGFGGKVPWELLIECLKIMSNSGISQPPPVGNINMLYDKYRLQCANRNEIAIEMEQINNDD